ncbi:MAG: hypothetical protein KDK70_26545 [Myxococcales bacterium]|nr:hypothetical protein [Myxococcales bacterium]
MRHTLACTLTLALVGLLGCPGDDGPTDTTAATTTSTGTDSSTTSTDPTSTGPGESSSGGSSSGGVVDSSSGGMNDSSSSGGMVCEPPVVGEWNSCLDDQGQVDNTLCNWIGNPQGTGTLTCLSGPSPAGGNVCIIRGCEDVCDCFDPPTTGTAEVVCAEILANGDMGCGLACNDGQTCPDGMMCNSGLCFWPDPA